MKNKWFIASILIVVLIGLCGAGLFAGWQGLQMVQASGVNFRFFSPYTTTATATEIKDLAVNGAADLNVQNDMGNISVTTGTDGQVHVKAEKTAWGSSDADAQAALKDLKVIIAQNGNNITISVTQPTVVGMFGNNLGPGSVKFSISVPAATAVTLHSSNGDVLVDGTSGKADAESNFGDVTLSNISGDVVGKSDNGDVTARKITTDAGIQLSSSFGSLKLDTARGSAVTVSSSNGKIILTDVAASGLLKIENQFGDIDISGGQAASAQLKTSNGSVRLSKLTITGAISAHSDFGVLTLTDVKAGRYDLSTQNGKIGVDGAQGTIKAHSDFGDVSIINAQNVNLDLSSNNGAIIFSGSLGEGPHSLKSDFGNIDVTVPADAALKVDLRTGFGQIRSDFSITVQGEIDDKHSTGSINGGGPLLNANTDNGNIILQSSK